MTDTASGQDYTAIISDVLDVEDITWGTQLSENHHDSDLDGYIVRYRGKLRVDLATARRQLDNSFRQRKIAALIREEAGRHSVVLIQDSVTDLVGEVLNIKETHWDNAPEIQNSPYFRQGAWVRFLGTLRIDSEKAYARLSEKLRPRELTPLFRSNAGHHEVALVRGILKTRPSNPIVNLVLFLATLFTVFQVGSAFGPTMNDQPVVAGGIAALVAALGPGVSYTVSLMAILLAHEFGHYLAGRYHRTAVTLPYFIPFPLSLFGTLGAFIQLKEPPRNRRVLLDIGVAGPLAGLAVAIPVTLLGLWLSTVEPIPTALPPGQIFEGNSILYLVLKYVVHGQWLPSPASYGDLSPLLYWVRYFFTGLPLPTGGTDVFVHPIAWAGWAGLLVTALNLIPAGQLDGGHLLYTVLGTRARSFFPLILGVLILLGLVWNGWWLWALLIYVFGRAYAEPLDQITRLDPTRRLIAIVGLIVFLLAFTPVPLRAVTSGGFF